MFGDPSQTIDPLCGFEALSILLVLCLALDTLHISLALCGVLETLPILVWLTLRKVIRMSALEFTGDAEDELQRLQGIPGLSPWWPFRFCVGYSTRINDLRMAFWEPFHIIDPMCGFVNFLISQVPFVVWESYYLFYVQIWSPLLFYCPSMRLLEVFRILGPLWGYTFPWITVILSLYRNSYVRNVRVFP